MLWGYSVGVLMCSFLVLYLVFVSRSVGRGMGSPFGGVFEVVGDYRSLQVSLRVG